MDRFAVGNSKLINSHRSPPKKNSSAVFYILNFLYILMHMAGHSHWKQVQHKKGTADQKRSQLFGKLLNAITAAAKQDPNPEFNPRLRTAVEKAKQASVPQENITRAIKRASEKNDALEELVLEAYGPGGVAIIMEAITDSRNRTVAEIKHILNENGGKWAESGSVQWAFETKNGLRAPKFKQELSTEDKEKLDNLVNALENQEDVQKIYTNS